MYARKTVEAGFTTVRDLGANSPQAVFALRDAIDQKMIVGPRIVAAGHWITMTGGHADGTNGYRADLIPQPTPDDGVLRRAGGVHEGRAAADRSWGRT